MTYNPGKKHHNEIYRNLTTPAPLREPSGFHCFSMTNHPENRIRIGAVSYLNTKPLVYGLEAHADEIDLSFDLPSRLADRLNSGDLDVALIPSIEAIANPHYTIISDACIGCRGPVWSVKLLSRVPGAKIKTLALDEGSRTSRVLGRILLKEKFGVLPRLSQLNMADAWQHVPTDAVMIIGDRAMTIDPPEFPHVWDLGEIWHQWTGLPFVFAVWAARSDNDLQQNFDRLGWILSRARDRGVENVDAIATDQAGVYGLTKTICQNYLSDNLYFQLGDAEKQGLAAYFRYAAELNVIAPNLQLQFHDCQTA